MQVLRLNASQQAMAELSVTCVGASAHPMLATALPSAAVRSNAMCPNAVRANAVRPNAVPAATDLIDTIKRHRSVAVMDAIGAEHLVERATWLHTPKFGPTYHFQRWRRAT